MASEFSCKIKHLCNDETSINERLALDESRRCFWLAFNSLGPNTSGIVENEERLWGRALGTSCESGVWCISSDIVGGFESLFFRTSLKVFVVCLQLRQSEERRSFISLNENQSFNIVTDLHVSLSRSLSFKIYKCVSLSLSLSVRFSLFHMY